MIVPNDVLLEPKNLPENHHIVRWLRPLLHQQLARTDVFVPSHLTQAVLAPPKRKRKPGATVTPTVNGESVVPDEEPRFAFYFTVPSEHWSMLCVRGSSMSAEQVQARSAVLASQRAFASSKEALKSLDVADRALRRQVKLGLTPDAEVDAQRQTFRDRTGVREGWSKFRVYRSNPSDVEKLAERFEGLGYIVVPVLPAFSWRDVEFPHDDERYQVAMVHAQSRVPCPWSKRSLSRRLYCRG